MNIDKFEVFESIIKVKKNLSFNLNDESFNIIGFNREILKNVLDICYSKGYDFDNKLLTLDQVNDKISKTTLEMKAFYKLPSGLYWQGLDSASNRDLLKTCKSLLEKVGKLDSLKILDDTKSTTIVDKDSKKYTFIEAAQLILKQNDNKPMTALEIWEEVNTQNLVETIGKTPKASMNAQLIVYSDNTTAIGKKKNSIFRIIEDRPYKFILINPELEVQSVPDEDEILLPSEFIKSEPKPKVYVKNPFGCKDEDGEETSTLCIIGKSGSGKTTSTEIALETMKHEYLLYIPIEGEYTFSQYTGEGFEMSSLGEFMMMAQNDLGKCYTVIFDECHRPITISKLNTDLLQALSSRRNRGGERFVTMDRSTKRMYTSSTDEFPITLKAVSGKVLVPDNFGIVCLSSNPSVICRNDDFLNRVDLVVFHESDRNVKDLTELKKLEPSEKNIESIRGLLLSDGKQ